ncbi:MAG: hypothetical protein II178_07765 [Selenomonadaceae bacterium]|nr:hypothetical protein [Selenomonadaceae bacterium]MBQ1915102.1 hypothetical protein [Selenomonadaceae bacterium]
MSNCATRLRLK